MNHNRRDARHGAHKTDVARETRASTLAATANNAWLRHLAGGRRGGR